VRHELQHWLSVVSLVSQGLGVALVPAALQQSALAGSCFVPIADLHVTYDTHCLWRSDRDQQALTAFTQAVQAVTLDPDNGALDPA
jgi:DNA-binding transcriptional LysR family regulator